ncbi:SHOCT domain-containing protein [Methylotuvimicrobium sp.]|uniref:SHOCT domain-containing protein n=1 Tax=Methylotuvimicrobium sp. TaxID=2822413 RepID=UPI003D658D0F
MKITKSSNFLVLGSLLFLNGCGTATPIMEVKRSKSNFEEAVFKGKKTFVSENTQKLTEYRIFHHADTGFTSLNQVREDTEDRANRFCEQRGLGARTVQETTSVPPHILGNFPRVELIFVCEEASKSKSKNVADAYEQLERLGNLLEKGLISKEEFESEKKKLFTNNR